MISKLKYLVRKIIYYFEAQKYKNVDNQFVIDLFKTCMRYGKKYDIFMYIVKKYKNKMDSINENLYIKLNKLDKDTLLRFFLKRFYRIDTATSEEIEIIDKAFEKARKRYSYGRDSNFVEVPFRDKSVKYHVDRQGSMDDSTSENVLMNYYGVAHTFFLVEYEMDGFNPKDGETILDCGAARGDTMLLFRSLYPKSPIYLFECSDENVQGIYQNMELNDVEGVTVKKTFLYSDSGSHILNKDGEIVLKGVEGAVISTISIDEYVQENNLNNIGLIKFDIEGGEQEALKGSIDTIKAQKPLLYIPIYHRDSDIYAIPEFCGS